MNRSAYLLSSIRTSSAVSKSLFLQFFVLQITLQRTIQIRIILEFACYDLRSWNLIRAVRIQLIQVPSDILDQGRLRTDPSADRDLLRIQYSLEIEYLHCNFTGKTGKTVSCFLFTDIYCIENQQSINI